MKYAIILLLFTLAACNATRRPAQPIQLTVTHIDREGAGGEIWARRSYMIYRAACKLIPDSLRPGHRITALPIDRQDSCKCIFTRVNR